MGSNAKEITGVLKKEFVAIGWGMLLLAGSVWGQSGLSVPIEPEFSLPTDSKFEGGDIVSPTICPADSNWLSYEIHSENTVHLFIYNRETGEKRRIQFPDDDLLTGRSSASDVDRDLAWCPKTQDGDIWLAFIGDANNSGNLYVYNVSAEEYHELRRATLDSAGTAKLSTPSWSPDGYCLTYASNLYGNYDIFILRNMPFWLKSPEHVNVSHRHKLLVSGEGDQTRPVWNPILGAGLVAYTHYDSEKERFEIRLCDAKEREKRKDPLQSFSFPDIGESRGFFGPTWNPGGNRIGFYQYDLQSRRKLLRDSEGDTYDLSVGEITSDCEEDTFLVRTTLGGPQSLQKIIAVASNRNRFRGPAWLPNGNMLAGMFDVSANNPLRVIDLVEWNYGSSRKYWLGQLGGQFYFPGDVQVVGNMITFTYAREMQRYLLFGQITPQESLTKTDSLQLCKGRTDWWMRYREGKSQGGFLHWINRPVYGPDVLVNRKWFVGSTGAFLIGAAILGVWPFNDKPVDSLRDWSEPGLGDPSNVSSERSVKITVRF